MCVRVNSYQDLYPLLLYWSLIVGGITNSHQRVHLKLFQLLAGIIERVLDKIAYKQTQLHIKKDR